MFSRMFRPRFRAWLAAPALFLFTLSVYSQTLPPPPPIPGAAVATVNDANGERGGSALIYNYYVLDRGSATQGVTRENTEVNITNFHSERGVSVHIFFINALTGGVWDSYICLLPKQTARFTAAELEPDPKVSGYVVAVAVDSSGYPINFNYLAGSAQISLKSGHAARLNAVAIPALFTGALPGRTPNATTARLNFDGIRYAQLPRVAALDNFASPSDGHSTLLVLNRIGGDFSNNRVATLGAIAGLVYDDVTTDLGFTASENSAQLIGTLSDSFPALPRPLSTLVPSGRTGWLEIWTEEDAAVLGAALDLNTGLGFNGGANLHKATATARGSLIIPISPSTCGDPNARADIAVALRASSAVVAPGGQLTYTITVSNLGPDDGGAEMQYDLPNGVTFVSCEVGEGTCDQFQNRRRLNFGVLAAGASKTARLVVRVNPTAAEGSVINFRASVATTITDPAPANNEAAVNTSVAAAPAPAGFKLGGRVTAQGRGLAGVNIYFSPVNVIGPSPAPVKTDNEGRWEQAGFQAGVRYRVTAVKPGCVFAPFALISTDAANNLNFVCR